MTVDCESVCDQVMKQQPYELRRRLYIMFKGEEGLDYGGIARSVVLHRFFSVTSMCRLITPADRSELTFKCHLFVGLLLCSQRLFFAVAEAFKNIRIATH